MKKIFNTLLILIFLTANSCGDIKRGLLGQKETSTEEFLVIKKDPLVYPPDFHNLPIPNELYEEEKIVNVDTELSIESLNDENNVSNIDRNIETSILRKIKKD